MQAGDAVWTQQENAMAQKNIFVVEDEEDILDLIRHHLTKEGFSVSTATKGMEAVFWACSRASGSSVEAQERTRPSSVGVGIPPTLLDR